MSDRRHIESVRSEFERTAKSFVTRTKGRFDDLGVVEFSKAAAGERVLEVGAGTGNFLELFRGAVAQTIALDLTPAMLAEARNQFADMALILADGARIPLRSHCIELVTSAQALHHIWEPLEILREMRRVMTTSGRMLIVDQVATDRYEEIVAMNELDRLRDPSHAVCCPASALRVLVRAAGMEIVDERAAEGEQLLSAWMWSGEFPEERMAAVRRFIAERGAETGMAFRRDGDDWVFTRRRLMLLAKRA